MTQACATPTSPRPGSIRLAVDPEMLCIGAARRFVRTALDGQVDPDLSSDLQLAVSELVTNAIEHGRAAQVKVNVIVSPTIVELAVVGGGTGATAAQREPDVQHPSPHIPSVNTWAMPAPTAESGRGLGIVRAVSEEVRVGQRCGVDVVVVRCRRR